MILTGESVTAARAAEIGLVNHVVPADILLAEATGLAEHIIGHSAAAVTACLSAVTRGINLPIDEALAVEASWFAYAPLLATSPPMCTASSRASGTERLLPLSCKFGLASGFAVTGIWRRPFGEGKTTQPAVGVKAGINSNRTDTRLRGANDGPRCLC